MITGLSRTLFNMPSYHFIGYYFQLQSDTRLAIIVAEICLPDVSENRIEREQDAS